jgi:hypothetical protein
MANCCFFTIRVSGNNKDKERFIDRLSSIPPKNDFLFFRDKYNKKRKLEKILNKIDNLPEKKEEITVLNSGVSVSFLGLLPEYKNCFTGNEDDSEVCQTVFKHYSLDKHLFDLCYYNANGRIRLCGWSKWSEPIGTLIAISFEFPELTFKMKYEEPNMDIKGVVVVQNGEVAEE